MATYRRKVLDGVRSGSWSSNYFRVTLSCGHKNQVAQGYNGKIPKTSNCNACRVAARLAKLGDKA